MEEMPRQEKISTHEAASLKRDITEGGYVDNTEATELITMFMSGRGFAVDREAMLDLIKSAKNESVDEFRKKLVKSVLEN